MMVSRGRYDQFLIRDTTDAHGQKRYSKYPKKYAHGFIVRFAVITPSFPIHHICISSTNK